MGERKFLHFVAPDLPICIGHKYDGVPSKLPRGYSGREITKKGNARTGVVILGFKVPLVLGVHCLKMGFFFITGMVATNNSYALACMALEMKPGPLAQARGICTRSRSTT